MKGSGTDADVFLNIFGEHGDTGNVEYRGLLRLSLQMHSLTIKGKHKGRVVEMKR